MLIAKEKKEKNIAEYILYMWQVEDLLRSLDFSMEKVEEVIVVQYKEDEMIKEEIREWYKGLIEQMHEEGVEKSGHLSFVKETTRELEELHRQMINDKDEAKYRELVKWAGPNLKELREKSGDPSMSDIEVSFTALYGLLLLRLQNREISPDTDQAVSTIRNMLAYLSGKYMQRDG
ncbi:MAG: DUF4924 family protein [Bacteroidota bacterium]